MKNFHFLDIKFNPLKPNFVFPKPKSYLWDIYIIKPEDLVSQECLDFFNSIGLSLYNCHLFRGPKGSACGIHVDGHDSHKPIWAINWIFGSNASEMIWYDALVEGTQSYTSAETAYQTWKSDQVKKIDVLKFDQTQRGPVLVRTDIPHRVVNNDMRNVRWCLSLRAEKSFNSWNDVVDYFKPYTNDQN